MPTKGEEETREVSKRTSPLVVSPKVTYRNILMRGRQPRGREMNVVNTTADAEGKEIKKQTAVGQNAASQQNQEYSNDSFHHSGIAIGAVRIPGLQVGGSYDPAFVADGESLDETCSPHVEVRTANHIETPVQVEAHVVPETHDIDVIVNQRLNDELEARLKAVAVAEVVDHSQEKRLCFLPRRIILGVVAVVVIGIALGVSIGVVRANSSPKTFPTMSPTVRSRQGYIADALNAELNGDQPWQDLGSPQNEAFLNGTIDKYWRKLNPQGKK